MIQVPAYEDPHEASELALSALVFAKREIGNGEQGPRNNLGPDIARYKFGIRKDKPDPWCAIFVVYCWKRAASKLGQPLPFRPSWGAKKLYKRMGKAGMFISPTTAPLPGDVACWDRGALLPSGRPSRAGHVGIVVHSMGDEFHTIEGNKGPRAKVSIYKHNLGEGRLIGFARV